MWEIPSPPISPVGCTRVDQTQLSIEWCSHDIQQPSQMKLMHQSMSKSTGIPYNYECRVYADPYAWERDLGGLEINTSNRAGVGIETIKERGIPLSPFSSLASTEYQTPPADPHGPTCKKIGAGPHPSHAAVEKKSELRNHVPGRNANASHQIGLRCITSPYD